MLFLRAPFALAKDQKQSKYIWKINYGTFIYYKTVQSDEEKLGNFLCTNTE